MQDTVFPADSSSGWMDMSKEVRFQGIQGNSSRHTDGASASQKPGTDDMDDKISMDTAGFQYAVRIALKDGISDDIRERIIACFDNYLGKADDISENPDELLFAGDEPLWNCLGEGMQLIGDHMDLINSLRYCWWIDRDNMGETYDVIDDMRKCYEEDRRLGYL